MELFPACTPRNIDPAENFAQPRKSVQRGWDFSLVSSFLINQKEFGVTAKLTRGSDVTDFSGANDPMKRT